MAIIDTIIMPNENEVYNIRDKNVYTLIADEYNSSRTYDLGDYCIYDYALYKCSTAVTNPEDFDSTKWERKTLIDIIKNS